MNDRQIQCKQCEGVDDVKRLKAQSLTISEHRIKSSPAFSNQWTDGSKELLYMLG